VADAAAREPDDYVIATEKPIRTEFLEIAFGYVNLNWQDVEFDQRYLRPAEVELLLGDPKSRQKLGWKPSVTFEQLVALMVEADLQALGHIPQWQWFIGNS